MSKIFYAADGSINNIKILNDKLVNENKRIERVEEMGNTELEIEGGLKINGTLEVDTLVLNGTKIVYKNGAFSASS
jgi:hypothetical protein